MISLCTISHMVPEYMGELTEGEKFGLGKIIKFELNDKQFDKNKLMDMVSTLEPDDKGRRKLVVMGKNLYFFSSEQYHNSIRSFLKRFEKGEFEFGAFIFPEYDLINGHAISCENEVSRKDQIERKISILKPIFDPIGVEVK